MAMAGSRHFPTVDDPAFGDSAFQSVGWGKHTETHQSFGRQREVLSCDTCRVLARLVHVFSTLRACLRSCGGLADENHMTWTSYPSDLTDNHWAIIEPLIPPERGGGRHREVDMREVINAMLYLNRTGCQWRALPHDFPPRGTVAHYFYRFRNEGAWQQIHDTLREQVRTQAGREPTPSAAIVDSQSVSTTDKGGFAATTRAKR